MCSTCALPSGHVSYECICDSIRNVIYICVIILGSNMKLVTGGRVKLIRDDVWGEHECVWVMWNDFVWLVSAMWCCMEYGLDDKWCLKMRCCNVVCLYAANGEMWAMRWMCVCWRCYMLMLRLTLSWQWMALYATIAEVVWWSLISVLVCVCV